jgi:hypothetical protein
MYRYWVVTVFLFFLSHTSARGAFGRSEGQMGTLEETGNIVWPICPGNWPSDEEYDEMPDDERAWLDPRLRYIYNKQHPVDCSKAKFLLYQQFSGIGLGAQYAPNSVVLALAVIHNRVLVRTYSPDADAPPTAGSQLRGWPQAGCPLGTPECYWLPTGSCTLTEDEILGAGGAQNSETRGTLPQVGRGEWENDDVWKKFEDERIVELDADFWGMDEWMDYKNMRKIIGLVPQVQVLLSLLLPSLVGFSITINAM